MRKNSGSALLLAMLFGAILVIAAFTLVGISGSYAKGHFAMNKKVASTMAAEAGIEAARWGTENSIYDLNGNKFLYEMSVVTASGGPGTLTPCLGWVLNAASNTRCDVYIERRIHPTTGEPFYRISSKGREGTLTSELVMDVRERQPFSEYLFFIENDSINIGRTTLGGLVHSNASVNFNVSGAVAKEKVTAVSGVNGVGNCTFMDGYDGNVSRIDLPDFTAISDIGPKAQAGYKFGPGADVQLEFMGNTGKVKIWSGGTLVSAADGDPIPSNGIIYVDGNISSLKGDVFGRCTVACTGQVDLTGPIRYVDQDGDPMYKLVNKTTGTTVIDEQSTGSGVVWDGTPYDYIKNDTDSYGTSKYNPALPSALGVMARNNIQVKKTSANYNMVFHCALFSAEGMRYADLSSVNGNWRFVGSNVTNRGGWRYNPFSGAGWGLSGEYIYDDYLRWNPPPEWISNNIPRFGPAWRSN